MDKPFKKVGFIGILVILMSLVMVVVLPTKAPWMMDGFITPIIAFEFIETPQEVEKFFGKADSPERKRMFHAINLGNRLDFIYMVLYTSFLFAFLLQCLKKKESIILYLGLALSIVVMAGDFLENIQLLEITAKLQNTSFEKELFFLKIFTWQKWGGLALLFLILSSYFYKGDLYSKIIGGCGVLSVVFGTLAFFHRSILNELFAASITVIFGLMITYCFVHRESSQER